MWNEREAGWITTNKQFLFWLAAELQLLGCLGFNKHFSSIRRLFVCLSAVAEAPCVFPILKPRRGRKNGRGLWEFFFLLPLASSLAGWRWSLGHRWCCVPEGRAGVRDENELPCKAWEVGGSLNSPLSLHDVYSSLLLSSPPHLKLWRAVSHHREPPHLHYLSLSLSFPWHWCKCCHPLPSTHTQQPPNTLDQRGWNCDLCNSIFSCQPTPLWFFCAFFRRRGEQQWTMWDLWPGSIPWESTSEGMVY